MEKSVLSVSDSDPEISLTPDPPSDDSGLTAAWIQAGAVLEALRKKPVLSRKEKKAQAQLMKKKESPKESPRESPLEIPTPSPVEPKPTPPPLPVPISYVFKGKAPGSPPPKTPPVLRKSAAEKINLPASQRKTPPLLQAEEKNLPLSPVKFSAPVKTPPVPFPPKIVVVQNEEKNLPLSTPTIQVVKSPPVLHSPPVAEVTQAHESRFKKIVRRIRETEYVVHSKTQAKVAESYGLKTKVAKDVKVKNLHAVSAAVRQAATYEALRFFADHKIANLQSLYSSPRDKQFLDKLQKGFNQPKMLMTSYRPLVNGQDICRVASCDGFDPHAQGYLMVDVYDTEFGPFSPALVESILIRPKQILIWVGHRFTGMCNAVFNEGAWLRTSKGIRYKADRYAVDYPVHDPCDWIWASSSSGSISWGFKKHFGDYSVVVFRRTENILNCSFASAPRFDMVKTSTPALPKNPFFSWICRTTLLAVPSLGWFFPKKEIFLDHNVVAAVTKATQARPFDIGVCREVARTCQSAIDNDAVLNKVNELFPGQLSLALEEQVLHSFFSVLPERLFRFQYSEAAQGQQVIDYNVTLRRLGTTAPPPTHGRTVLKFGLVGGAALLFGVIGAKFLASCGRSVVDGITQLNLKIKSLASTIQPGAIIESRPVLSAWLEETVLYSFLIFTPTFGVFLRLAWIWWEARKMKTNRNKLAIVLIGLAALYYPELGKTLHYMWNGLYVYLAGYQIRALAWIWSWFRTPPPQNPHDLFMQAYHSGNDAMPEVEFPPGSFWFQPSRMVVSRKLCSNPLDREKLKNNFLTCTDTLQPDPQVRGSSVFQMMPTSYPLFVPSTGDFNLSAVVYQRILQAPPKSPEEQLERWNYVRPWQMDCHHHRGSHPMKFDAKDHEAYYADWIEHFEPKKRKKYEIVYTQFKERYSSSLEEVLKSITSVPLFVKTNEKIVKYESGMFYLKPRAIANVPPMVQVATGPYIWHLTSLCKQIFGVFSKHSKFMMDGKTIVCYESQPIWIYRLNGQFFVSFGVGRTDRELTDWMQKCRSYQLPPFKRNGFAAFILVAGDDSLVYLIRAGHPDILIECDAAMYDQSQSEGPLEDQYGLMLGFGVPPFVPQILRTVAHAPYMAIGKNGNILIDRSKRPMRDTGGPDTTFGNTLEMARAWVETLRCALCDDFCNEEEVDIPYTMEGTREFMRKWHTWGMWRTPEFKYLPFEEKIAATFADLGFKMKIKFISEPTEATFLKGAWYPTIQGLVWGPLPSRILKVGSSLRDPTELYKHLSLEEACQRFLTEQALSLAGFLQVPILRRFVQINSRFSARSSIVLDPHKVQTTGEFANLEIVLDDWCLPHRYGLTKNDFLHCEETCNFSVFHFQSHPALIALGKVDYS